MKAETKHKCHTCQKDFDKNELTLYVHRITKKLCDKCYEKELLINNPKN